MLYLDKHARNRVLTPLPAMTSQTPYLRYVLQAWCPPLYSKYFVLKAFLSDEMMYSCALWDREEGGVRGDLICGPTPGDLESAQRRKIHHVLRKARVKPGHRILEFGTGWGGLAIEVKTSSSKFRNCY